MFLEFLEWQEGGKNKEVTTLNFLISAVHKREIQEKHPHMSSTSGFDELGFCGPESGEVYRNALFEWVQGSDISLSHGAKVMHALRTEVLRCNDDSITTQEPVEYLDALHDMYKTVMDGMMSAVHRGIPHFHINRTSTGGLHIAKDEEEIMLSGVIADSDEEEEEDETGSDMHEELATAKKPPNAKDVVPIADARTKKKEDQRKRRVEEEQLLIHEKKVRDDKGNILNSLGPHAAPRLSLRNVKPNQVFPSRKTLQQRINLDQLQNSSDDEEDLPTPVPGPSEEVDAVAHLTGFMKPLSGESLKKISESAKVKVKPSSSTEDCIAHIVKTAVRLGCEKACVLMDKHKIIDAVTTHVQTSPLPTAASIDFLNSLPDELKVSLGPVLGLPKDNASVVEMWERMVAMGFLSVLTNLRLGPLKKIANELSVSLPDTSSTEKYCEAVVFAAFPGERLRVRNSKLKKQTHVTFSAPAQLMRTVGDMGFVTFVITNVSTMRKDNDRHYSPEFDYGGLKWSLLCMSNKESLALYLCQTGTVFCKFVITVVNQQHHDDSICNEGTQRFSSASTENDWGFNSVVKFDTLLDPKNGFWNSQSDSISIEVGIVFVEAPKQQQVPSAVKQNAPKERQPAPKPEQRINEEVAQQLLELERLESLRKKIKQDITKMFKEEEKTRKDIHQKGMKSVTDCIENAKAERNKIIREQQERERREQQERAREMERIRQAQEQNTEMQRKISEFTAESAELVVKKKAVQGDIREAKKAAEALRQQLVETEESIGKLQQTANYQERQISQARKKLADLQAQEPDTPSLSASSDDEEDVAVAPAHASSDAATAALSLGPSSSAPPANDAENDIMNQLRESLAGILGT